MVNCRCFEWCRLTKSRSDSFRRSQLRRTTKKSKIRRLPQHLRQIWTLGRMSQQSLRPNPNLLIVFAWLQKGPSLTGRCTDQLLVASPISSSAKQPEFYWRWKLCATSSKGGRARPLWGEPMTTFAGAMLQAWISPPGGPTGQAHPNTGGPHLWGETGLSLLCRTECLAFLAGLTNNKLKPMLAIKPDGLQWTNLFYFLSNSKRNPMTFLPSITLFGISKYSRPYFTKIQHLIKYFCNKFWFRLIRFFEVFEQQIIAC